MSSERSSGASGGVGIVTLTTLTFVVLKLTHQIDWAWQWVLSPLWIGFGLLFAFLFIGAAIVMFGERR